MGPYGLLRARGALRVVAIGGVSADETTGLRQSHLFDVIHVPVGKREVCTPLDLLECEDQGYRWALRVAAECRGLEDAIGRARMVLNSCEYVICTPILERAP